MLKNRILIIFSLIFILLTLFVSNCFATESSDVKTYTVSYNGTYFTFPNYAEFGGNTYFLSDYPYVVFYSSSVNGLFLCIGLDNNNFNSIHYDNNRMTFRDINGNNLSECRLYLDTSTNTWVRYSQGIDGLLLSSSVTGTLTYFTPTEYFYSSSNVLGNDGTIFFQKTPLKMGVIAQVVSTLNLTETITTILVGSAKLLIPSLVCLIAFWKGWSLLSKTLHQA